MTKDITDSTDNADNTEKTELYLANWPLKHNGKTVRAHEGVELTKAQAKPLLASGVVDGPVKVAEPADVDKDVDAAIAQTATKATTKTTTKKPVKATSKST